MTKKIDLYLITGFLGSGKTTFLKEILKNATEKKIGIIMNEFGKVGIDGGLVKDSSSELIEINRGSIFCDCLKLSFVESLKDMSEKPIDALFVEGSGLADPSNIGEILEATEILIGDKYNYCGSICLVDSTNFIEQSEDIEAMNRQVKHSHLAVVSKIDLIDNDKLDDINKRILSFNSQIDIKNAVMGKLDFDFFNDWKLDEINIIKDETTNNKENKPKTLTLEVHEPCQKDKLIDFLNAINSETYRLKGFVDVKDEGLLKLDVVGNKIDLVKDSSNNESQIVIISKVGPGIIKSIITNWESIVGTKYKLKNS